MAYPSVTNARRRSGRTSAEACAGSHSSSCALPRGGPRADALRLATILLQVNCRARAKRPPVSFLALLRRARLRNRDSGGTHVAPSERWRSGWDHEFESPLLQRRVSNEPCGCRSRPRGAAEPRRCDRTTHPRRSGRVTSIHEFQAYARAASASGTGVRIGLPPVTTQARTDWSSLRSRNGSGSRCGSCRVLFPASCTLSE
jgi:hypothetical protein